MSHIEQVAREQLFASFQYEIYRRGLGGERPATSTATRTRQPPTTGTQPEVNGSRSGW